MVDFKNNPKLVLMEETYDIYASISGIVKLYTKVFSVISIVCINNFTLSAPLCQGNILYKENYFEIIKEPAS